MRFPYRFTEASVCGGHHRRDAEPPARARASGRAPRSGTSEPRGEQRPAARALPWEAWLATLWERRSPPASFTDDTRLRARLQAARMRGVRIVAAEVVPLIDPRGAAALAVDAWTLVARVGRRRGDSWRAWGGNDGADDDCATFARWANRYRRELQDANAVDPAEFPDWLCARAHKIPSLRRRGRRIRRLRRIRAAAGTPARSAYEEQGANITREDTLPSARGLIRRADGATPRDEMCALWRGHVRRQSRIPTPRSRLWSRILPSGATKFARSPTTSCVRRCSGPAAKASPRPYNLSLGTALRTFRSSPSRSTFSAGPNTLLPLGRAAALLRSPFIAVGGDAWMSRARLERAWIEGGRATITMRTAIAALLHIDPPLAQRWAAAIDGVRWPASGSPREHADAWRSALAAIGWPGTRPLDSHEYQALRAWDKALAEFASLSAVERRMTRSDALATLRSHVASVVFQPESAPAPIQITGMLEAAGQPFDALWLAGLTAERLGRRRHDRIRCCPSRGSASEMFRARAPRARARVRNRIDSTVCSRGARRGVLVRAKRRRSRIYGVEVAAHRRGRPRSRSRHSRFNGANAIRVSSAARMHSGPCGATIGSRGRPAGRREAHRSAERLSVQGHGDIPAGRGNVADAGGWTLRTGARRARPYGAGMVLASGGRRATHSSRCRRRRCRFRDHAGDERGNELPSDESCWRTVSPLVQQGRPRASNH